MASTAYLPSIASLISLDDLPESLRFIENGIATIFNDVYFKKLQYTISDKGDGAFYSLTIVLNKHAGFTIPGAEIEFILNPDFDGTTRTEIPITLEYQWKILGLIKQLSEFSVDSFAFNAQAFFDLLSDIVGLDHNGLLKEVLNQFQEDPDPLDAVTAFVDDVVAKYGVVIAPIVAVDFDEALIEALDKTTTATGKNPFEIIFDVYISNLDVERALKNVENLFAQRLRGSGLDYIKEMLIPKVSASVTLGIGIAFPRKMLTPLDPANNMEPFVDQSIRSTVLFNAGKVIFNTESGIGFEEELGLNLNYDSQIGNTGLIIEFTDAKLDLSRTKNIIEADLDGRSPDFVGIFVKRVSIKLPEKWFKNQTPGSSAKIFGDNLLIGTGGVSGVIGLEAVGPHNILWANIGDNGFKVGFEHFDIQFKQNKVLSSNIKGAMQIPKFVYPAGTPNAGDPVTIGIEGHVHDNGDFNLTASTQPPYPIELKDVFIYHIKSLELGRQEDDFYIGTSGKIEFQGFLKDTLKLKAIDINRLRIYSDGTIEFQGGSIALVEPIVLSLGPVEITVSAIHYGSHQKEVNGVTRKFNYFGFDGGLSVDPLGVEIRGDGVKFYYCTDNDNHATQLSSYLHIQTLHLDLTIPSSTPVAIINGWLSIPEPGASKEYAGGIKLQLPQAKITGSADMKLQPRYPAFIIDASLDFPAPIALGPVGIYGFRGLIGYRYVAEKEAAGLVSGVDSWYDYYKAPPRGIHVKKFNGPDRTTVAGTPFSIGAGASLGTSFDNGTVINIKAMVLLSIPSLFMIDGRAAILSARLGLEDSGDPPFFAFIAIGDNSLELGFGADFKMPTKTGKILKLYADIQAGFFFNDASKWYVNIGTKDNPITARILTLLDITSYVMLSAKGIEAGARGEMSFKRKYGPIRVAAWAYIEIGGKISFERPQFGAYFAAGVGADIDIKIVSLYASFDMLLGVEAPKPFLIYGEFRVCVKISILWVFKFKFCGNLSLKWEFDSSVDTTPINPMINPANAHTLDEKVMGVNMLSNEKFQLANLGSNPPANLPASVSNTIIPLDTYIDIKTEKGLVPGEISAMIGGATAGMKGYFENVPPEASYKGKDVRQVKHTYSVRSIEIKSWNPSINDWEDYHPYGALYPSDPSVLSKPVGQFQLVDGQHNTIRLLATTPLSYTEQGQPGWFKPAVHGFTPGYIFCRERLRNHDCANFLEKLLHQRYYSLDENQLFYSNQAAFYLYNKTDEEYALVTDEANPFGYDQSLRFNNTNTLQIRLRRPSVDIKLKLTSYSSGVIIRYYAVRMQPPIPYVQYGHPDATAPDQTKAYEVYVPASDLNAPVVYSHPEWKSIVRIEILPQYPNSGEIMALQEQIAQIQHHNFLIAIGINEGNFINPIPYQEKLDKLRQVGCQAAADGGDTGELPKDCLPELICQFISELRQIEPCFYVDRIVDYGQQKECAENLLGTILRFDKLNPNCNILKDASELVAFIYEFMAKPNKESLEQLRKLLSEFILQLNNRANCGDGCIKDEKRCDLWDKIIEIRNSCLPHPQQINRKYLKLYAKCFHEIIECLRGNITREMRKELGVFIKGIFRYLSRPVESNYADAWESVNAILDYLYEKGNCNCDTDDLKCHTLLHDVCWLSYDDHFYNINIPSQAALSANAQETIDSVTNYIQPVWRPDTSYYVHFVLRDMVIDEKGNASGEHDNLYKFTYGFSTAGPLGFFHEHEKATYGDYLENPNDPNSNVIEDANGIIRNSAGNVIGTDTPHPEKYALTSLRRYIDYQRSYPNADGNLLSAKPLFYNDETTRIDLFFANPFAYHFFQNWEAYNGKSAVDGRIKIVIKDPREGDLIVNPPYLDYDPADTIHVNTPQTVETWADDPDPQVPHIFDQYANLLNSADCIVFGGNTIIPKANYLQVVPKHLKPEKLYTAIVNNLYDLNGNGTYQDAEIKEVHKFVFKTSIYASFKDQVNSYLLSDNDPISPTIREAVFTLTKGFTATEIQAAYDTIQGTSNVLSDGLVTSYQHAYDRILEGILGFKPLQAPISTEFNVIKDSNDSDTIIALIIRNPEPFNNPKLPLAQVADTIEVLNAADNADVNYKILFSKDYSQAIIMRTGLSIAPGLFDFRFRYKIWDGSNYIVPGTPDYSTDEAGTIIIRDLEIL